ncbi:hypothetical protein Tco_1147725, partial [Tanacetum coccineum]
DKGKRKEVEHDHLKVKWKGRGIFHFTRFERKQALWELIQHSDVYDDSKDAHTMFDAS